ncbi:response regulator [Bradyrhizobium manausense]|nr:response regulator [Bradyrhizobium manausense]
MTTPEGQTSTLDGLDDCVITAELARRPCKAPDYEAENRALTALVQDMTAEPRAVLQKCAELAVLLCHADSAGISLPDRGDRVFRWRAVSGELAAEAGRTVPDDARLSEAVIARDSVVLFREGERLFPGMTGHGPHVYEVLAAPWHARGKPVGALWAMKHTPEGQFDAEDARLLQSLSHTAAGTFQTTEALDQAEARCMELERGIEDRTRDLSEAQESARKIEARLAQELEGARQLQQVSLELLSNRPELLYEQILDAAMAVMRSQGASMQILEPDTGILKLLAWRGFHPDAAAFWDRVDCNSASTCSEALKTGRRILVSDTETCTFMAGTEDLEAYRLSSLRAVQSTPLQSRNGRALGMVSTHWREPHEPSKDDFSRFDVLGREAADLIERAQTEAALRESEARLKAAVDLVELGRYSWNPQTNELKWDEKCRAMWGLPADATVDYDTWLTAVHPEDVGAVEAAIQRCIDPRGDGVYDVEYRVLGDDRGERWIATRGQTQFENDKPVWFYGVVIDVTDRKRIEKRLERRVEARTRELEEANNALRSQIEKREIAEAEVQQLQRLDAIGQITSGVAHDFNNLLSVVLTNARLLSHTVQGPYDQEGIELIRSAADRGAKLIAQLLAFSRQQRLEPDQVDLNSRIAGMGDLLGVTLGGTVQLKTIFAPDLWLALVDPNQIEMIVLNLAINARDAMQPGGTLTIETFNTVIERESFQPEEPSPGDYVVLAIKDTGNGIPDEVLLHVFEPFFTTKEPGKGSGLGLAQVFGFAKQSGGGVRIETRLGEGTAVKVFLPRARIDAADHHADSVDASKRLQTTTRLRVLVVDDDKAVLRSTVRMLDVLGYAAVSAESGSAALRVLASNQEIDLVLADFAMPEMSGGEVAKAIRAMRPILPVVLMSGYRDLNVRKEFNDLRIILKPFTENDLVNAISAALR